MLVTALVVVFLFIIGLLGFVTRETAQKELATAMSDIRKAHRILSAEPHKSARVARAIEFLDRWV